MPRKFYRKKSRRRYARKRGKWRQQKLAVGTVQRIARNIAKAEDKKNMKKYVHVSYVKDDNFQDWPTAAYKRALPLLQNWRTITGTAQDLQMPYSVISRVGGNLVTPELVNLDGAEQAQLELRIHGIQTYGIVANNSPRPMRFEARLLWIPNLNKYTQAVIDYLIPRFTMLHKSGQGTGNLLYQGYNKRDLATKTATGIPATFVTLARKVMYLPAAAWEATITGNNAGSFDAQTPLIFKRFRLSKYFKKPRVGFVRQDSDPNDVMSNGNFVLAYWTDQPGNNSFSILATSNMQYSIKSNMNDDVGA